MPLFKLKKAGAFARLVDFEQRPTWQVLTSRVWYIYNIPPERVKIAFKDHDEMIRISDNQELHLFYETLYQPAGPAGIPMFVVHDAEAQVPDG
jgi:hypothetical protein